MPFNEFLAAVALFFENFLAEMKKRITVIGREGWPGKPCSLDVPRLTAEQEQRSHEAKAAQTLVRETDWASVRGWLKALDG